MLYDEDIRVLNSTVLATLSVSSILTPCSEPIYMLTQVDSIYSTSLYPPEFAVWAVSNLRHSGSTGSMIRVQPCENTVVTRSQYLHSIARRKHPPTIYAGQQQHFRESRNIKAKQVLLHHCKKHIAM